MNWRPDNWENPYESEDVWIRVGKLAGQALGIRYDSDVFEAGADAMLEALKREALVRKIKIPWSGHPENDLSDFELTESGHLVLIPDEGE